MWSPLHQSYLQPIELVWNNVNGTVGRQYTTTRTLADFKSRINSYFATLDTNTVAGCINKANNILEELLYHMIVVGFIQKYGDTTDISDDESDNYSLGGQ